MQVYLNTLNTHTHARTYLTLPNPNTLSHSLNLSYLSHHPFSILVTLINPHSHMTSWPHRRPLWLLKSSLSPTHTSILTNSLPPLSIALTLPPYCVFTSPSTITLPLSSTHRNSLLMVWIRSPPFFFWSVAIPVSQWYVLFFFFFNLCVFVCFRICVCVRICVCICDFERENHKSKIFVLLIFVFVFVFIILGRAWWDGAHKCLTGRVWGLKKSRLLNTVGLGNGGGPVKRVQA